MKLSYCTLLSLLLIITLQPLCEADPSNSNPEASIKARAQSAKEIEALYLAAKASIEKFEKSSPASLNANALGTTGYTLHMLEYKVKRLACFSETAAVDYQKRHGFLRTRFAALVKSFLGTPAGAKALQKVRAEISTSKFKTKRSNSVAKIRSLISSQKFDQAEQLMLEIFKALDPLSTIYWQGKVYDPFGRDFLIIEQTYSSELTKAATESVAQERATLDPDFAGTLTSIDQAITSVGSSGKATWEGAEVTGPQLMEEIGATWAKKQVAGLRCRTLDLLMKKGGQGQFTEFEQSCDKFGADIVSAMAKLIEADALRVDVAGVKRLYVEYLKAIAPIARQSADDLHQKLGPALEKLIAKSPELEIEVDAYRMATEDILFWRKRFAEAMAADKMSSYPPLIETHVRCNSSTTKKIKIYPPPQTRVKIEATLRSSAPMVVTAGAEEMMNANITCTDLLRYESSKGLSSRVISRYMNRCYAIVPILSDQSSGATLVQRAAQVLKADLLVSEQVPALTLEASYAVMTADRADLLKVGGSVYEMYLESLVTRFGNLKDSASIMVRLGKIGIEDMRYASGGPAAHVLMRYGVDPHWVQHDYFFVGGLKREGS